MIFILTVVLVLPPASCPGDAVFCCESNLFAFPKEDTSRNHKLYKLYLQHCSRTVQPKYLSVCSAFYGGLFPDPGRVAYNVNTMNVCEHYKVGPFQRRKDSLVLLTRSLQVHFDI